MSLDQPTSPEAQGDVAPAFTICHHEVANLSPTGYYGSQDRYPAR